MSAQNTHLRRVTAIIGSERFFRGVIVLFVLQAAWIALSGLYPMAFDENFHLGIIRLYAHHVSPFWSGHPAGSDALGAVSRDPSYLYQWLMSFPYRLVAVFTASQTVQVLVLRFIDIGLFAAGLVLYRRLLLKTGASRTLSHLCLALFALIPISPLLAAQVNYDNLFLPLTALMLLMTINFSRELRVHKRVDGRLLLLLLIAGLLTSLVKYVFLPIFLVLVVCIAALIWRAYPGKRLWPGLGRAFTSMPALTRWLLAGLLIVSLGLFSQRYAVNLARYHKPVPACGDVLTAKQCLAYGPWRRDYNYEQSKPADSTTNPLTFNADWFYGMWLRTFFAVDGPTTGYQTRGPLPVPAIGAIVFISLSALAAVVRFHTVLKKYDRSVLLLFLAVTGLYAAMLWLDNYQAFLRTGRPVAINGRYLLPLFPLLLIWCALGVNEILRRRPGFKLALAAAAAICMLWGGGALTYILRSSDTWYWHNQAVYDANHAVQHVLGPVTPGYNDPKDFMGHHGT